MRTQKAVPSILLITIFFMAGCTGGAGVKRSGCIYGDCKEGLSIQRDRGYLYVGQMAEGQRQGEGSLQNYREPKKYFGSWENGQLHGKATLLIPAGTVTGVWDRGSPKSVVYTGQDGVFEGSLQHDGGSLFPYWFPDKGEVAWPNGDVYRGGFKCQRDPRYCGLPWGDGEFRNAAGEVVKGSFSTVSSGFGFFLSWHGAVLLENGKLKYFTLDILDNGSPIRFAFTSFADEESVGVKIDKFTTLEFGRSYYNKSWNR